MSAAQPAPGSAALAGVRVVDLTRHMSGPYASLVLGDFGADVIKLESAPHGDPSRQTGTNFIAGESTMFLTWNRNKRSICVDLRSEAGLDVARRLVDGADVLMENYRPGVADEIGLGYEAMSARNDRLIYCSTNAFGSKGPWKERPGTDPVVQAMSGVMSVTGERDGGPVLVGIPIADYTAALITVQAIVIALYARERTSRGQYVEVPMVGGLVFGLTTRVGPYFLTGEDPTRWGSQHSQVVPYQAFKTADGYAVAGCWVDAGWKDFCVALGWPELAPDERYDSNVKRVARRDEVAEMLQARFLERTTAEWERRFAAQGALFAPVNSFSDILNGPQSEAMGFVTEVDHPVAGRLKQVAPVIRMSDTPASIRHAPPLLGEHTADVLAELGLDDDEVRALLDSGAVVAATERPA
jgi:formyl-CoA transferase/CoA:oxalate CoA-transferase